MPRCRAHAALFHAQRHIVQGQDRSAVDRLDPGDFETVVARSASCGADEADAAVAAGAKAWDGWRRTSPGDRAAVLFRAAEWMRSRRHVTWKIRKYNGSNDARNPYPR